MSISVAMAVYNGEKYIAQQIDSVLKQLKETDELVISYDASSDNTKNIIEQYVNKDSRVKLIDGPSKGVVANFEHAVLNCNNEYIFLCDQDDIWFPNKVEAVLSELKKTGTSVVLHDAQVVDETLAVLHPSFFALRSSRKGIYHNILKNSYMGCCMAFEKKIIQFILPFPPSIPMHDQWIGLLAEKYGTVRFLNQPLILHRRHGKNASRDAHAPLWILLKWRVNLIRAYRRRCKEIQSKKNYSSGISRKS